MGNWERLRINRVSITQRPPQLKAKFQVGSLADALPVTTSADYLNDVRLKRAALYTNVEALDRHSEDRLHDFQQNCHKMKTEKYARNKKLQSAHWLALGRHSAMLEFRTG